MFAEFCGHNIHPDPPISHNKLAYVGKHSCAAMMNQKKGNHDERRTLQNTTWSPINTRLFPTQIIPR